jgi:hypothetical protein
MEKKKSILGLHNSPLELTGPIFDFYEIFIFLLLRISQDRLMDGYVVCYFSPNFDNQATMTKQN